MPRKMRPLPVNKKKATARLTEAMKRAVEKTEEEVKKRK